MNSIAAICMVGALSFSQTEDTTADKQAAAEILEKGNEALREGRAGDAVEAYTEAYGRYPSPKIFLNLGRAFQKVGRPIDAANTLQRFIEESSVREGSKLEKQAKAWLRDLDKELGLVQVQSRIDNLQVEINEESVYVPESGLIRVAQGMSSFTFHAPGFLDLEEKHLLPAGKRKEVVVTLLPVPKPALEVAETPTRPAPAASVDASGDDSITKKWWFWTAIAAGTAVAVGGTAFALSQGGGDVAQPELGRTNTGDGTWTQGLSF